MKRNDIHRPSAIYPTEYEFVAVEHDPVSLGFVQWYWAQRQRIIAHMTQTGGAFSDHEHKGNCHVCGAHCIYTAVFYHCASNTYIRTGFDCAEKMGAGTRRRLLRPGVRLRRAGSIRLAGSRRKDCWSLRGCPMRGPCTCWWKTGRESRERGGLASIRLSRLLRTTTRSIG